MKNLLLILSLFTLIGCRPQMKYNISRDSILSAGSIPQAEIIHVTGTTSGGPFTEIAGYVGTVGSSVDFYVNTESDKVGIQWPKIDGYYLQVNAYKTKNNDVLMVLRKIPAANQK